MPQGEWHLNDRLLQKNPDTQKEYREIVLNSCVQSMMSKPVYGCSALGMRMPSGVWLFSSRAATIRGRASAEPLRVWQSSVFFVSLRR